MINRKHMIKSISSDIQYIGVDDVDLDLFESQYIVPEGMAYNSYVILDEKVAVMDTVDARKDLDQIHGFFYDEKENLVTVDVIPDLSVKDEPALCRELTRELGALLPGKTVLVTVDHNYSE